MIYMVDKVKGGVKRGCVHFDTPSFLFIYEVTGNLSYQDFSIRAMSLSSLNIEIYVCSQCHYVIIDFAHLTPIAHHLTLLIPNTSRPFFFHGTNGGKYIN